VPSPWPRKRFATCIHHGRSHNGLGHRISILCRDTKWRSVKYENVYLRAYENGTQLRRGLTEYFNFYNATRTHQALDYQTPDDVYYGRAQCRLAA
jgi:putative transposase